ncbi:cob(I)yrinic acid a,c-diamide adenosyltransferase [Inmirania thermothiophila]|uniref:Corrinoid adenosyltransferase n=1 Tax=Inmirania thermothiophila TaxID=1750597 RepID=A0A3N1Y844_9GAMM|nr:cob(I)yrinic acid a,c-diamide adenosyltransferase [Inmirania thermothiophila]ROR34996.1 ATP:cob(I)alamin adenosyltransferase [Inmirania thermothiophila]
MGHRLSKIYTRTGDTGETGLAGRRRVPKDAPRVEAMGAVDELNSQLGVLLAHPLPQALREVLTRVQHRLFDLGGALAMPGHEPLDDGDVAALEEALDRLNAELPPLKEFILPGGSPAAAHCHLARAVCRRAERRLVTLAASEGEAVPGVLLRYLNRLSDLLFVAARVISREDGVGEVLWRPKGT